MSLECMNKLTVAKATVDDTEVAVEDESSAVDTDVDAPTKNPIEFRFAMFLARFVPFDGVRCDWHWFNLFIFSEIVVFESVKFTPLSCRKK